MNTKYDELLLKVDCKIADGGCCTAQETAQLAAALRITLSELIEKQKQFAESKSNTDQQTSWKRIAEMRGEQLVNLRREINRANRTLGIWRAKAKRQVVEAQ
jgi:hypothetical protein